LSIVRDTLTRLASLATLSPSGEGKLPLRPGIWRAVLVQVPHALVVALGAHVDVRIVRGLARRAAADLDVDGVALGAVDQAIAVRDARLPSGGVPWPEHGLAAVLAQHHLALEHVDELVLVLVPVALRRGGARLEPREVHAELVEPDGIAEPLALAPEHGLA